MPALLLDTHVWAWSIDRPDLISNRAREVLDTSGDNSVSAISFYEIAYKVRIGKWPEMAEKVPRLAEFAALQQLRSVSPDYRITQLAGTLDWEHRDPFDRIIAASAIFRDLALVTRDPAFATLPGLRTVW